MGGHDYDISTDSCKRCGATGNILIMVNCSMKYDPNDLQASCCPGKSPFPVFNKGKWHDPDCAELKTNMKQLELDIDQIFAPVPPKKNKCTCGSASLGSDRHSDWCDGK